MVHILQMFSYDTSLRIYDAANIPCMREWRLLQHDMPLKTFQVTPNFGNKFYVSTDIVNVVRDLPHAGFSDQLGYSTCCNPGACRRTDARQYAVVHNLPLDVSYEMLVRNTDIYA